MSISTRRGGDASSAACGSGNRRGVEQRDRVVDAPAVRARLRPPARDIEDEAEEVHADLANRIILVSGDELMPVIK